MQELKNKRKLAPDQKQRPVRTARQLRYLVLISNYWLDPTAQQLPRHMPKRPTDKICRPLILLASPGTLLTFSLTIPNFLVQLYLELGRKLHFPLSSFFLIIETSLSIAKLPDKELLKENNLLFLLLKFTFWPQIWHIFWLVLATLLLRSGFGTSVWLTTFPFRMASLIL